MHRRLSLIAASVLFVSLAHAQPVTQPTSQPTQQASARPPSLMRTMKAMSRTLRQISARIDDPKRDGESLALLSTLQEATVEAKNLPPEEFEAIADEAARARALSDYRTRMLAILRAELALEEALLNGNRDAAKAVLATLNQQRREGHDAYDVEDVDAELNR